MGDRGGERVRDEDGPGVKSACPEARSRDGTLTGKGFMIRHLWIPLGLFIGLVILFETTDLDLRLSDPFFDFDRGVFFWKDSWWATTLIHSVGRIAILGLGILIGVLLAVSFVQRGLKKLVELRMPLFFSPSCLVCRAGDHSLSQGHCQQAISRAHQAIWRQSSLHQALRTAGHQGKALRWVSGSACWGGLWSRRTVFCAQGTQAKAGAVGASFAPSSGEHLRFWSAGEGYALCFP